MNSPKDIFTLRQTMERQDFECYHYYDPIPPVIDFHEHEFFEVFFFLSGDVSYVIEGRTYQLRPGDILLTDNRDIHKPDIHDNGKCQSGRYCFIDHIIQPVINASSIVIPVAGKHIDMQNDGEEGQRRPCCH